MSAIESCTNVLVSPNSTSSRCCATAACNPSSDGHPILTPCLKVPKARSRHQEDCASGDGRPLRVQKAMESYRKAADGGNCLAMMAIGDLYAAGSGVRADQAQAQSWRTKAQSCQGGNIAMLQQQVTQYKAKAAAARDPALYPVLAALPDIPNSPAQASRNNPRAPAQRNADSSGFNQSILDGLIAGAVIVIAFDLLSGSTRPSDSEMSATQAVLNGMQVARCTAQGLGTDFSGMGNGCS